MTDTFINGEPPDGIGKTLEDIRIMLAAKHDTSVSKDDPILMMVSIFNAYLEEMEKLHGRHNQALTAIISAKTAEYISGVKETTDALTRTLSEASVESVRLIFEAHGAALHSHKLNTRWCAAIVALSAVINVAVFILK